MSTRQQVPWAGLAAARLASVREGFTAVPSRIRHVTLRRPSPVWVINAVVALAVAFLAWQVLPAVPMVEAPVELPWWALALLFLAAEVFVVHLQFRRGAQSFSLAEIPLVLGLFFASPTTLIRAQLVGMALALLYRRQAPLKLAFNLGQTAVGTCLAVIVFALVRGDQSPIGLASWAATLLAVLCASLFSNFMIFGAIALTEGSRPRLLSTILGTSTVANLVNATIGLTAVALAWLYLPAVWLVAALIAVLFISYVSASSAQQRHASLRSLYESSQTTQRSQPLDSLAQTLLRSAKEMMHADVAELILFADGASPALRSLSRSDPPVEIALDEIELHPTEGIWARIAADRCPLLLTSHEDSPHVREYMKSIGVRDALVAPLLDDGHAIGTLMVANRIGDVRGFRKTDVELFETFTNQASIALRNGRLITELTEQAAVNEHLATHDPLTGLANRVRFGTELDEALAEVAQSEDLVGVLLFDLDRFKEINDSLGHHSGDQLLCSLASRLGEVIGSDDLLARLGGDEFAVLLRRVSSADEAMVRGRAFLVALEKPFAVGGFSLPVRGSLGVALYPRDGMTSDRLLQCADVAMYWAKEANTDIAEYRPGYDHYSAEKLALAGELRRAVEDGELLLHYQPKVDFSGALVGVEALVRWEHPRRGLVAAAEFIPLAERTGLSRAVSSFVLEHAIGQLSRWQESGDAVPVAVNLSPRDLTDGTICDEIQTLLARFMVEPCLLELELTEECMLHDPEHTTHVLTKLSDLGVRISIDDFGTGYSSLAYLARLPVDCLKIDRSFVQGMLSNERDEIIVRSTVELARNLNLLVVAEGVESPEAWQRLASFGCDVAQGFYVSKALCESDLRRWRSNRPTPASDTSVVELRPLGARTAAAGN